MGPWTWKLLLWFVVCCLLCVVSCACWLFSTKERGPGIFTNNKPPTDIQLCLLFERRLGVPRAVGRGGGLRGGRFLRYPNVSHNGLLASILNLFGDTRTTFGDPAYAV
ncbi:MAG TPA: hypothetical protein VG742_07875, partial [Dongiaceae bacterium]|nr:hypothetical protein [Dongiaceae bacterium]